MVNLELLQVGTKVKYATLCEAFGVEKKTGKSKQLQMKEFERYIKMEKEGTWFNIVEIYSEPKEKVDGRKDNGKSEASQKALEENRHEQESFFSPDELQLALLWTLGLRAYSKNAGEKVFTTTIPQNELYVAVGLCNEYFTLLTRNKHYYTKQGKSDKREAACNLWQVNLAYDKIYSDMRGKTITAFNQLQRKKLLNFSYWKTFKTHKGEHTFTEEQMAIFLEKRQDTFEWWNEQNPRKKCDNIGEIYTTLHPKEVKEFEEKLKSFLDETTEFKGISHYTSCFKVMYDIRTIKNELTKRGYNVGNTKEEYLMAFQDNMGEVVKRINNKFLERHDGFITKKREEHFNKLEKYEKELEEYHEKIKGRIRLGKSVEKEPTRPNCDLIDYIAYEETKDILRLGIQSELNIEQLAMIQGIEHVIENNKNNQQ